MNYHFTVPKALQGVYSKTQTSKPSSLTLIESQTKELSDKIYNKDYINKSFSEKETYFVSNKSISDNEWDSISKYIKNSPFVKSIHLSGVSLNQKGLYIISEIILTNNRIKSINLEWNFFNELVDEFEQFCEAVSKSDVQYLALNNNKISSAHFKGLIQLVKSVHLISLNLKWNEIGNDIVRTLIENIKSNVKIQEINLAGNKISHELIAELNDVLIKNQNQKYKEVLDVNIKTYSNLNFNSSDEFSGFKRHNSGGDGNFKTSVNDFKQSYSPFYHYNSKEKEDYKSDKNNDNQEYNMQYSAEAIGEEYKARYDNQLLSNLSLEKTVTELEMKLKNYMIKFAEIKDHYDNDIETEKNMRFILENQYNQLKEEYLKKDLDYTDLSNDFESKIKDILIENDQIRNENILLKEKLSSTIFANEERLKETRQHYSELIISHLKTNEELKKEFDNCRSELFENLKLANTNYEKKLKTMEDSNAKLTWDNSQQVKEIQLLKKEINEMKMMREIENKEHEKLATEEESKKSLILSKEFEIKCLNLSNNINELQDKIKNLKDENSKLKIELQESESANIKKLKELTFEKDNLKEEISHLLKKFSKSESQLGLKEEQYKVNNFYYRVLKVI